MKRQEVDGKYKVDSTKGGSLINPISYKGDVMVQVWMDSRVLATLCKWLEKEGEYPRFLSHVVRLPLEMLADHFVEKGEVEMVDDTLEARILLEGRFHVSLNKGKKGMKNLMHNVTLSSRRGTDLGSRVGGSIDYTRHDADEPVEMLSQEEARAKYYREQAKEKQRIKDAVEAEKKKAIDSGLVVKDDGTPVVSDSGEKSREEELTELVETYHKIEAGETVTVKEGMTDEEFEDKCMEIKERDEERMELEKNTEISEDNIVKE